jgi:glutamine amidotransferase-like uncharacterized protein
MLRLLAKRFTQLGVKSVMRSLLFWILAVCLQSAEPMHVVLFDDAGSAGKGVPRSKELLGTLPAFRLTPLDAAAIRTTDWQKTARVILFTGGSGGKQSKTLGTDGVAKVRSFVEAGGGYVGICAGAYLACDGFSWGLKVLDAKTVSSKWQRGIGDVQLQFTPLGQEILGFSTAKEFPVRYANGPIYMAAQSAALPDYQPLAFFKTELAKNGTPPGVMTGSPAMVAGQCGKGRVLCSSPHPEQTPGMDAWLEKAVRWAGSAP